MVKIVQLLKISIRCKVASLKLILEMVQLLNKITDIPLNSVELLECKYMYIQLLKLKQVNS